MERIGHVRQKTRTRTFDEGNFRGFTDYLIETDSGDRPAPQAFLVHQAPEWVLPPHFHREEQFQVVTGGSGMLGKHSVAPITVHYTSRESGYGPLVAGAHGLDYLSLRAVSDPGAWYLPGARASMRPGLRKRQTTMGPITIGPLDTRPDAAGDGLEVLKEPDDSGLAIWLQRLSSHERVTTPPQHHSGGRFHVVVGGSLQRDDACFEYGTVLWRDASDAPMPICAGPQGLALLILQFPERALDVEPQKMDD